MSLNNKVLISLTHVRTECSYEVAALLKRKITRKDMNKDTSGRHASNKKQQEHSRPKCNWENNMYCILIKLIGKHLLLCCGTWMNRNVESWFHI